MHYVLCFVVFQITSKLIVCRQNERPIVTYRTDIAAKKDYLPYSSENLNVKENESCKRKDAGKDDSKPVDVKPEYKDNHEDEVSNSLST